MTRRLRVGIVGTGFMGAVHARAAQRAGAELVAVATRSGGDAAAARMGAARTVPAVEDLLGEVDVVHVCTPNHLHEQQARVVLEADTHVVCEKPLATDAAAAERLTRLAGERGLVATVPFVYRFYGTVREMRGRARAAVDEVRQIRGSYLQDWLAGHDDTDWRVDPALGGASRAFGDIGVHWVDLAEFVTGHRITRLAATTRVAVPKRAGGDEPIATEDLAAILFVTDRDATGVAAVSQVSLGRKNRLELDVDAADAAWSFCQERPEELWEGSREGVLSVFRGTGAVPDAARFDRTPPGHPQGYQDCFDAFVADTYAAIRGESPEGLPTFADGTRAAVITGAVLDSARSGTWVDVAVP